ncbi:hypothetical protein [Ornithinibacillus sp. FSL M8-0202]|uniref:hypothetical protein n=1 Tax=Ornithinibacillus sp. FSL M8-0202 TaxID=2921616 RepID=UPI0030D05551
MTYQNNLGHMLTMADAKTLIALFSLWEEQDYGEWVTFTEYQIVDRLDMGMGGRQYQLVRNSLDKLRNTSVVFQEAYEIETAQALYVMISGIASMESTSKYIKEDGVYEIPLEEVYGTLFLEDRNPKNKAVVEKGCEELKSIDIIKEFSFIKEGRSYTKLEIENTDWLKDILGKKDYIRGSGRIKQLTFNDIK